LLLRIVAPVIVVLALLGTPACGDEDLQDAGEQAQQEFREGIERARDEFEERRARLGQRIREVLGDLEKVVPRAQRTSPTVRSRGRDEATTIDAFMTELLQDIDGYWTTTFEAAGLPTPQVRYLWIEPGAVVLSGCGEPAGDRAAFYCPADDTIYVAQQFAADLYQGVAEGLPGQSAGFGRATGDFAVAYVLAHEYAHNLQHELGVFDNRVAGPLMRGMHHIAVDRSAGAGSYADAVRALTRGEVVGIFPEATISRSFTLKETKSGSARMAFEAKVPVVPVGLWGTQRLWTKGLPKNFRQRGIAITILVGEPLHPADFDGPDALARELRTRLAALVERAQREYPQQPAGESDRWWLPAHLGGTAPTPEEALELDRRRPE